MVYRNESSELECFSCFDFAVSWARHHDAVEFLVHASNLIVYGEIWNSVLSHVSFPHKVCPEAFIINRAITFHCVTMPIKYRQTVAAWLRREFGRNPMIFRECQYGTRTHELLLSAVSTGSKDWLCEDRRLGARPPKNVSLFDHISPRSDWNTIPQGRSAFLPKLFHT